MNIFQWLKIGKPNSSKRPDPVKVVRIDGESLAKELKARDYALKAAEANEPPQKEKMSAFEHRLEKEGQRIYEARKLGLNEDAKELTTRYADLRPKAFPDIPSYEKGARAELAAFDANSREGLIGAAGIRIRTELDERLFKKLNGLDRQCKKPEAWWKFVALNGTAIAIEAGINLSAFWPVVKTGLIGTALLTTSYAAANVAGGIGAGLASCQICAREWWRRAIGAATICGYPVILVYWSSLLGYYRSAMEQQLPNAGEQAMEWMRTLPLDNAMHSAEGVLLIAVTIGAGLFAAASVWAWKDPFPGYHRVSSAAREAGADEAENRQDHTAGIAEVLKPIKDSVVADHKTAIEARSELRTILGQMKALIHDTGNFRAQLTAGLHGASNIYRSELAELLNTKAIPYAGEFELREEWDSKDLADAIVALTRDVEACASQDELDQAMQKTLAEIGLIETEAYARQKAYFDDCEAEAHRRRRLAEGEERPAPIEPPRRTAHLASVLPAAKV